MCGIVAVVSKEQPFAEESLRRATSRLMHRGPDEQHHWLAPDGRAGLGHTRLSIIDLSTGAQPIANEDESLRIVVNGEFYDFERIRGELEQRGHRFRTRTDSEIALHLYEEKGVGCLDDLRGEFAFALWDQARGTLFAARDRFGIKPLFYARIDDALILASEVKAIVAAGARAAWDSESVFHNLFLGQHENRTLFDGIQQVPAGHYLIATRGAVRVERYWDTDYPRAGTATEEVTVGTVRTLLEECVRLRMRADVPVGCYVSGGVDSSAVLGMAAAHSGRGVAAFTIAFDHPAFDESASAGRSAAHVGADFHPVAVTETDFADCFADAVWHGETIQYNAHGPARYLLSRAVQKAGYKVVLAGEGADELFAGYAFARTALLSPGNRWSAWARRVFRLLRSRTPAEMTIAATSPSLERACRVIGVPPELMGSLAERLELIRSILRPEFAQSFAKRDPFREFMAQFDVRRSLAGREPVKQLLYLWLKSLFVNYVLAGERLDMAHAVEVRLPYLDHKLFELTRTIPASVLASGGGRKQLLREAVKSYVTDEVYRGAKQPFFAPPSTLRVGNPLYTLMQDLLRSDAFRSVPFFDQRSVVALLDRLPRMDDRSRGALDPIVMMLASLTILQQRYRLSS